MIQALRELETDLAFSLNFIEDPVPNELLNSDEKAVFAQITIGDFYERLLIPLGYWNKEDYVRQWKEGLERLLNGENATALIVSMQNPKLANFIEWWLLYRQGNNVFIQNQLLFMDQLKEKFEIEDIYKHISSRKKLSEEGEKISEWQIGLNEINKFLGKFKYTE